MMNSVCTHTYTQPNKDYNCKKLQDTGEKKEHSSRNLILKETDEMKGKKTN